MSQVFSGPMVWFFWMPLVVGLVWWKLIRWENRSMRAIVDGLSSANKSLGTSFPESKKPKGALMMGEFGQPNSYCLLFDPEKGKVAVTQFAYCAVHDLDYIQEWQLHWSEKSVGGTAIASDPYLIIGTSDLHRPTLTVKARTLAQGRDWERQLSILKGC